MQVRNLAGAVAAVAGFAGLLAASPAMAGPVNLVTNGGFENVATFTPDQASGSGHYVQYVGDRSGTRPSNGGTDVPLAGWTTHTAGNQFQRGIVLFTNGGYDYNTPHSGNYAIQLESYTDYISQHVNTIAGHQYQLSYYLSAYQFSQEQGAFTGWVQIRFDNVVQAGAYSEVVTGSTWHLQTYNFTAGTNGMDLAFWNVQNYPQLDDISLTDVTPSVPEPGSLALAGLALAGLATSARRRKA